jgi:chaperonin GroES
MRVLNSKLMLKLELTEQKTASGLYIPEMARKTTPFAVVEQIGIGADTAAFSDLVKVGDRVIYDQYAGTPFERNGEKFVFIAFKDLLAVE